MKRWVVEDFVDKSPEEVRAVQAAYHESEKTPPRKKKRKSKSRASWISRKQRKADRKKNKKVQQDKIDAFYASWEWKRLRYDYLKGKERRCECCGARPSDGVRIVVDHIKPIRHYWHLRFEKSQLQMLCDDCNMGKGSRDETDWREQNDKEQCDSADIVLTVLAEMASAKG